MVATADERTVVLVTGGTGLVGEGVKWVIDNVPDPRFRRKPNETWIFLSSKEADLRYMCTHTDQSPIGT